MSPPDGAPPSSEGKYAPVPTEETEQNTTPAGEINGNAKEAPTNIVPTDDDAEIVVPPDGGWGWVIVAASFMCNMIVDGIIFSFGMFLTDISTDLNAAKPHVALVSSLMSGFYLMAGPFVSALANRYGFRIVSIAGSIVGGLAFVLSYFATSVDFLCISYGFLGGIGFGLIYVPAVVTVGYYFERWRALATGIGVCGSGIGAFVFGPICAILIKNYGWRNTLLIQSAIVFSCVIFGCLFRPLKPTKLKDLNARNKELETDIQALPATTRTKMEKVLENMKTGSMTAVNNNSDYPTVADVYHTISAPQYQSAVSQEKRLSIPLLNKDDKPKGSTPLLTTRDKPAPMIVAANRRHTFSEKRVRTTSESSHTKSKTDINRPMYREDIFFAGSLARLPQYQSKSSLAYNLSVTHIATKHDIEEEEKRQCQLCPEAVKRTLLTMLDFSLLMSPTFLILAVSGFLTMMGFYVPFMYITDRAEGSGIDTDTAMWLVSTIGIANTIGRVLCGIISSLPGVNTLIINNVAISIGGIATILSGISLSSEYQFFYSVVFGLAISCFASLRSILVVDLLGLEKLTNAFGLLLLFQGIAAAIGAPVAGAFMEATGSYDASFYLSGSMILASAIICYPLNYINKREKQKNKENAIV